MGNKHKAVVFFRYILLSLTKTQSKVKSTLMLCFWSDGLMKMGWDGRGGSQLRLTLWAPLRWAALRSSGRWGVVRGAWGGRSPPSYEYGRGGRGGTESDSYTQPTVTANNQPQQQHNTGQLALGKVSVCVCVCVCVCVRVCVRVCATLSSWCLE